MIGRLTGQLAYRGIDHIMLDVGGVGYIVYVSERTLAGLPAVGKPIALFTEMVVREDLMQLFGFPTRAEKEWHRLLTSVQGVGAKASMAVLGTLGPEGVGQAIALGDANAVKAAPGVGPKLAQRVVNELKDKAPAVMALDTSAVPSEGAASAEAQQPVQPLDSPSPATKAPNPAPLPQASAQSEALSALSNLGYAPADAARAIAQAIQAGAPDETTALIRAALRLLAPPEG